MQPPDRTPDRTEQHADRHTARTLVWIGVGIGATLLGAAVTYAIVRAALESRRTPDDPTSQRIQQLIDEANSLLKTLDEQKHTA